MEMQIYATNYDLGNKPNSPFAGINETQIWAHSDIEAQDILKQRNGGEVLPFFPWRKDDAGFLKLPSDWLKEGNIPEALHAAMWVAMWAIKSGKADAWDLLNDNGVLHSLSHVNLNKERVNDVLREKIMATILPRLLHLESITPGFNKYGN